MASKKADSFAVLTGFLSNALSYVRVGVRCERPIWRGRLLIGLLGSGLASCAHAPATPAPGLELRQGAHGERLAVLPEGAVVVLGTLKESVIDEVVRMNWQQVMTCYRNGLGGTVPKFDAKLVVRFLISPAGDVSFADVPKASDTDSGLNACIVERVRTWKFPPPTGGSVLAARAMNFWVDRH